MPSFVVPVQTYIGFWNSVHNIVKNMIVLATQCKLQIVTCSVENNIVLVCSLCRYHEINGTLKHTILAVQVAQRTTGMSLWGQSTWKTSPWLISWCSRTHRRPGGTSASSPSLTGATSPPKSPSSIPATKCPSKQATIQTFSRWKTNEILVSTW